MSYIKVGIKIRALSERERRESKTKKDQQWIETDSKSLKCIDFLHPCSFTFDHIFGSGCVNYDVYLSLVKPVLESCLVGLNCTILTYGPTSTGKNYTMMGTDKDPGIILFTIKRLFNRTDVSPDLTLKIRAGYIEIYKEKVYDLLNERRQVLVDPNRKCDKLTNVEVPVESVKNGIEILYNGSYKRKSSTKNNKKLSSRSHAIFRITIESEDKTNGKIQNLNFVHVAGCGIDSTDSLQGKVNDDKKSLMWLNFVISELSEGKKDIKFCSSILTNLLQESLTGNANTAIICNIRADIVDETITTLKFANQVKNIQTTPVRNQIDNDQALGSPYLSSGHTDMMLALEDQLKDIANVKVENALLNNELEEVKATFDNRKKWFEEEMKAAELAQQKLKLQQMEEKKLFTHIRNEFERRIKQFSTSNQDLLAKCEVLHKNNVDSTDLILRQNESLNRLKKQTAQLKRRNYKLTSKNEFAERIDTGIKRKIERLEDDISKNIKMLKNELHGKKIEVDRVEPSTKCAKNGKIIDACHSMTVPNHLVGCIMGLRGSIMRDISQSTDTLIKISDRSGSDRSININGTTDAVSMAVDLIKQKIKREDRKQQRHRSE